MHRSLLAVVVSLLLVCVSVTPAGGAPAPEVTLTIKADNDQPAAWPVLVELTLTNISTEPIRWWCGGPDLYPGAEHFLVEVRSGAQPQWHPVAATNGQYKEGSGIGRELKTGEAIVVPLAIVAGNPDGLVFRIQPREWRIARPAEGYVRLGKEGQLADRRRADVITATIVGSPPFMRHLAETYPDAVVLDAMFKLVTVDNPEVAGGAARVLARQTKLPAEMGATFADLVALWLPRTPHPQWGGLREYIATAALNTRSEPARAAMLKLMAETTDPQTRWLAMNAIRLSPGDAAWFTRAKERIEGLPLKDEHEIQQRQLAITWLDSKIKQAHEGDEVQNTRN